MGQKSLTTLCLSIISLIAILGVLMYGKEVFAPILTALLLGIILTPLSDFWDRLRIPAALSAFFTVTLALLAILLMILLIEPYVTSAINRAPIIWDELRSTIDELKRVLRGIEEISEDVADAISDDITADPAAPAADAMAIPSLTDALFYAPQFAAQFMIFAGTLYFFLLVRTGLYGWVEDTFDGLGEYDLRLAGKMVSRYVLTISAINMTLGICVAIAMSVLGVPSPILWGILAFSLNFVMYLGPIALIGMLTVTGIVVFDGPISFAPAFIYFLMNLTEAQFVTPTMVGKSLSVNPLTVFLSLVFWLWLWGPIGGIIAIPMLIWVRTVYKGLARQTISSGTPGKLDPNLSAGATS